MTTKDTDTDTERRHRTPTTTTTTPRLLRLLRHKGLRQGASLGAVVLTLMTHESISTATISALGMTVEMYRGIIPAPGDKKEADGGRKGEKDTILERTPYLK